MGRILYRLVRKFMQPLDEDSAERKRGFLSLIYIFFAWNACGLVLWQFYKGKGDWAKAYGLKTEDEEKVPISVQFAQVLGIKNAKVTRISGLTVKEEYEIKDGVKVEKEAEASV